MALVIKAQKEVDMALQQVMQFKRAHIDSAETPRLWQRPSAGDRRALWAAASCPAASRGCGATQPPVRSSVRKHRL